MKRQKQSPLLATALVLTLAAMLLTSCGQKENPATKTSGSGGDSPATHKTMDFSQIPALEPGNTTFTLFVYMIGSDLESYDGAASRDLAEMLAAATGDRVRAVIMAGGSTGWTQPEVQAALPEDSASAGIFTLQNRTLTCLAELGETNMASEKTLSSFLRWAKEKCPSERSALILWNHGGGTLMGYGYDENFPHSVLSLQNIHQALASSGLHFDFIGFDACLMGTVETGMALAPYADYLVASEETEPGSGWYYTDWLTALGEDPAMDTVAIGQKIIRDYMPRNPSGYTTHTLSLLDLSQMPALYDALQLYFENEKGLLKVDYKSLARARSNVKAFGDGMFEQIDLVDFIENNRILNINGEHVLDAVEKAVVYTDSTVPHANGIALYFPFQKPDSYQRVSSVLRQVGYTADYFSFFDDLMNTLAKGQEQTAGLELEESGNSGEKALSRYLAYDWYNPDWETVPEETLLDPRSLVYKEDAEGYPSLHFTESQRELLVDMSQWYTLFDNNTYTVTGLGSYKWAPPKSDFYRAAAWPWPTINGTMVSYFEILNEPEYEYGLVPVVRNGTDFDCLLIAYSGAELEDGGEWELLGLITAAPEEISLAGIQYDFAKKGAQPLHEGDTYQFVRYDLSIMDTELQGGEDGSRYKYFGEPLVYDGHWDIRMKNLLDLADLEPGSGRVMTQYLITDLYQNIHRTPLLSWMLGKDGQWYYKY